MVFSSLIFLFFFLPAALFCYYIVPQKFIRVRNAVLLLFSLFFYFYGEQLVRRITIVRPPEGRDRSRAPIVAYQP